MARARSLGYLRGSTACVLFWNPSVLLCEVECTLVVRSTPSHLLRGRVCGVWAILGVAPHAPSAGKVSKRGLPYGARVVGDPWYRMRYTGARVLGDDGRHKHVTFHGMNDANEEPLWHVCWFF